MKFQLPNAVTRKTARLALKTRKHSPSLLFVGGIGLGVATVVSACHATLKLEETLESVRADINEIKTADLPQYSEADRRHDLAIIYIRSGVKFAKLYGPAFVLGVSSIAALTQSHRILNSRNAAMTAAYAAVDKAFKEYRERVVKEFGDEKDRELRYGVEEETVKVEDKNGPKKVKVKAPSKAAGRSMYARFFDEFNRNWAPQGEYNHIFLRMKQQQLTDQLRARGHLFLNEAYDELGLERTSAGTRVGWLWDADGDGYVDFGIWDPKNEERLLDFVTGRENAILLDFNVDGEIWDKI